MNKHYRILFLLSIGLFLVIIASLFFIFHKFSYNYEKSKLTDQISTKLHQTVFEFSGNQISKGVEGDSTHQYKKDSLLMDSLNLMIENRISIPLRIINPIVTVIDCATDSTTYCNISNINKEYLNTPISASFFLPSPDGITKHTVFYFIPEMKYQILSKLKFAILIAILIIIFVVAIFIFVVQRWFNGIIDGNLKDDFIQNITHELKTPIATTAIAIDIFKRNKYNLTTDKTKEYINIIIEENLKMKQIVDKLLSISIVEQGKSKMAISNININNILLDIVKNFNFVVQERNGNIITYLDATTSIVEGDDSFINMIFTNLIDNAIKYSEGAPMISVETTSDSKGIFIKISDQGIGIPSDSLGKIFEKTYRVNSNRNISGFGLGLYFVKQLVEIHNGNIDVRSIINKGTEFTIFLPFKQNK